MRAALAATTLAALAGCASPGPPLPPSLKLPEPVTDLTAIREGSAVKLRWTTSARTTDRQLVAAPVTAAICREAGQNAAAPKRASTVPCTPVVRVPVSAGASEAQDVLSAELNTGAARVLTYRVWLVNEAGRTAGPSSAAYAPAGAAPEAITGLHADSTKPGVVLQWDHSTAAASVAGDLVELTRVDGANGEAHFRARDTGGAIDRTAEPGGTYTYTVQRVRPAEAAGRAVELRGGASAAVRVAVRQAFPPEAPAGLVAAPGTTGIDLSWEPNVEAHVAGYRVYRRVGSGEWSRVGPETVRVAAYTDTGVAAGAEYEYRVTAISDAGLESQPSAIASQAAR